MFNNLFIGILLLCSITCLKANDIELASESVPNYDGNRILLTSINIIESNKDELRISMNAINTGRNLIEFGVFSNIPEDLELKFEESFHRSSLKDKEIEIKNLLFSKVLKLPAGKIIRNIELSLSSDEELYKSLGKKKQRYARHYQPKQDKTKPNLKYKTGEEPSPVLSSILKKKKKKEKVAVKQEIVIEEELEENKTGKVAAPKENESLAQAEAEKKAEMKKQEKVAMLEAEKQKIAAEIEAEKQRIAEADKKLAMQKVESKEDIENKKRLEKHNAKVAKETAEKEKAMAEAKKKEEEAKQKMEESKRLEAEKIAEAKKKEEALEKKKQEDMAKAKAKEMSAQEKALAEAKKKQEAEERKRLADEQKKKEEEIARANAEKLAMEKEVARKEEAEKKEAQKIVEAKKKTSKKEIKKTNTKFEKIDEKQKKEEDDKEVLAALGLDEKNKNIETQSSKQSKKRSGSLLKGKEEQEEGFDMGESINASKNSYAQKEVCPDLYIDTIFVVKRNNKWLEIEYILNNSGKGPAHLLGESSSDDDNLAIRAFLSSTDKLTRGSLPIGGGFIYNSPNKGLLEVNGTYRGKLKLDIKKLTRFTPYLILSVDPFNAITECDKTNNKHPSLISK